MAGVCDFFCNFAYEMKGIRPTYRILRSVMMTVIAIPVIVYVGLYVALSLPEVQEKILHRACKEASKALGGELRAQSLTIRPFSEVILKNVSLDSPSDERIADIKEVAAGIDLWQLVSKRKVVINYAELIGLDASLVQMQEGGPFNIQFMIDALSPKDKTKPPTEFDLRIRNIVVRDSKTRLRRPWVKDSNGTFYGLSDIQLSGLRLDLSVPILKNNDFLFDIRNMQCDVNPGISLRRLSAKVELKKSSDKAASDTLKVMDLQLELPNSEIAVGDVALPLPLNDGFPIDANLRGHVTPSDFSGLFPAISSFDTPWNIEVDAAKRSKSIDVKEFMLENKHYASKIELRGSAFHPFEKDSMDVELKHLSVSMPHSLIVQALSLFNNIPGKVTELAAHAGDLGLNLTGKINAVLQTAELKGMISTASGKLALDASASDFKTKSPQIKANVDAEDIALGTLLSIKDLGSASFRVDADVTGIDKDASGNVDLEIYRMDFRGYHLMDIVASVEKEGNESIVSIESEDDAMLFTADASCILDGTNSRLDVDLDISRFDPDALGIKGMLAGSILSSSLNTSVKGNNVDCLEGYVSLSNLKMVNDHGSFISLPHLEIRSDFNGQKKSNHSYSNRSVTLRSDWIDADFDGVIFPSRLPKEMLPMISSALPSLVSVSKLYENREESLNDFTFDILVKGVNEPYDFFNLPVRPLSDIPISGRLNTRDGYADIILKTPHILQGKDKIIRDTSLQGFIDSSEGKATVSLGTIYPAKKGDVQLAVGIEASHDVLATTIKLNPDMESRLKGEVSLDAGFSRTPDFINSDGGLAVSVNIHPSTIGMGGTDWKIANGNIEYGGKRVAVNNFLVQHANQYVKINGIASERPEDKITVTLNDIDLEYIFGTLNINYVTFGGMATGEVTGRQLLSKKRIASTRFLRVRGLSYNGAVLGDGDLASDYDVNQQKVGIYAVIRDPVTRERRANIDGGIWVTRDSLSFSFDANKVNLQLMKPFVSAFCPDLKGRGSGRCKLYGTFSDIDLVGDLYADTIAMKIDFTNTWYYAGGDSVHMGKGRIDVPPLTLYDREGHTAELSGWLTHRYFHEPEFDFRIRNAKSILCYDTNEKLNPNWYGTIYGSGSGQITGEPGIVSISMDMTTRRNSTFTYVITDAEDVEEYNFLTFTDRRKEEMKEEEPDSTPLYLKRFLKRRQQEEESSSDVVLSLRGTVTPDANVTLIMDPKGGDRIVAKGSGALQMDYASENNDFRMFGKYVLDEGSYNFTLQDIIIKNFSIRRGSSISFNGDPMDATLDIAATYRVNTNLTDLDKSFATDRELNRTNVPVDALLLVTGPMTQPDINFDIELPTLTQDVERKVKSIVSTNDMMSRQIIYLLALNRFYTPEYTGSQSSGSEWSSMASSTISSQLSNILSQMTDKLSVAPSFRSDKGDFSDMEFDLALSSRLLNNRLLVNGNFGYRDRNTSTTQFIGDFDLEYLLNRSGNLRLKAYNHFNDQNYYLRSALTTQGVGIVYRRDFNHLFRKKKEGQMKDSVNLFNNDSVLFTKPELIKVENR